MKISGYTTTRNVVQMNYPFIEAIESHLDFCDEVVVADSSDGSDGTIDALEALMEKHPKLRVVHVNVPWDAPNHGIYDGQMKAVARSKCTGDYLWQFDVDEIAEPGVRQKIERLLVQAAPFMDQVPIIALPVVEYWGSKDKVRIDVNPWKWRLSKNLPYITHGIPKHLRKVENGLLYAQKGTDGCVTPDTKIMTPDGEKFITDIKIGDLVLTHKGRFRKVTRFYKRPEKRWNLRKISLRNYFNEELKITENHPIYFAKLNRTNKKPWRKIVEEQFISLDVINPQRNNCVVFPKLKTKTNKNLTYQFKNKKIFPNENIGFLLGLYLGSGWVIRRTENKEKFKRVSFALSAYQDEIVERLENILKHEFDITNVCKRKCDKKNSWEVNINNADFAKFVFELCGTGSRKKLLDHSVYEWGSEAITGLLEGLYQSDGADCNSEINIAMANGSLLSQIKILTTKIDIFPSITSYIKETGYNKKYVEMFQFRITGKQANKLPWFKKKNKNGNNNFLEHEDYFAVPCSPKSTKISKFDYYGHLYNLEVDEDHSYVANGITVHNCDYIHAETGEVVPFSNFVTAEVEMLRRKAITDEAAARDYQMWFNMINSHLPVIHHFSWFSIETKILNYKYFWNDFWVSLYNEKKPDGWNPFFADKSLDEVSNEEIKAMGKKLAAETGGHIFHTPWNGTKTNHITLECDLPPIIKDWCKKHSQ